MAFQKIRRNPVSLQDLVVFSIDISIKIGLHPDGYQRQEISHKKKKKKKLTRFFQRRQMILYIYMIPFFSLSLSLFHQTELQRMFITPLSQGSCPFLQSHLRSLRICHRMLRGNEVTTKTLSLVPSPPMGCRFRLEIAKSLSFLIIMVFQFQNFPMRRIGGVTSAFLPILMCG